MTWFGIYLVIYYTLNLATAIYYLGKDEPLVMTKSSIVLQIIMSIFHVLGVIVIGTNVV